MVMMMVGFYSALSGTLLSGTIPPSIGRLTALSGMCVSLSHSHSVSLSLYYCGECGAFVMVSSLLTWFTLNRYLSNTLLTGSVPAEFGQLQDLGIVYLNGNALQGAFPSIVTCPNLRYLYVHIRCSRRIWPSAFSSLSYKWNCTYQGDSRQCVHLDRIAQQLPITIRARIEKQLLASATAR